MIKYFVKTLSSLKFANKPKSDKIIKKAIIEITGTNIITGRCITNQNCSLHIFVLGNKNL